MPSADSQITGGTYRRLLPLAQGGMGRVEVVIRREGQFRRLYAIKRLHEQYRADQSFRTMFLDEARIAGLIRHPNAVSVLDVGEDDDGPFLVMDYVEGMPVSSVLEHSRRSGERLPVQHALSIVSQAARGLHAAHEVRAHDGTALGLVHRDVSPANLLVSFDGIVRVTDFGVAKALGRMTRTESGVLKGKYGYMSPEQLGFRDIDRRSDLFSLGVILYELLAGERLYVDTDVPAPRRILTESPPDIGDEREDLAPALVELCFELLAKESSARPATAKAVADRLDRILSELALEEGKLDLGEYMVERFGDLQQRRRETIEKTIDEMESAPRIQIEVAAPGKAAKRPWRWVAAALVAGGGVLALGWMAGGSADDSSTPSGADAPAGVAVEAEPTALEAEPTDRPPAEATAAQDPAPTPEPVEPAGSAERLVESEGSTDATAPGATRAAAAERDADRAAEAQRDADRAAAAPRRDRRRPRRPRRSVTDTPDDSMRSIWMWPSGQ